MSERALPLSGLRVVDCTVERGELTARLLGDLGADVVKVEPPGGSPARQLAPVRNGVSLAFAVRNAGKRGVVLDLARAGPTSSGSTTCSRTPTCWSRRRRSSRPASTRANVARAPPTPRGRRARRRSGSTVPTPTGPRPVPRCRRPAASPSRPASPSARRCLPPGHLVDDAASVTSAFGLLCALYQREQTGAGQFVEVAMSEAIAADRRLGVAQCDGADRGRVPRRRGPLRQRTDLPDLRLQGRVRAAHHPQHPPVARDARVAGRTRLPAGPGVRRLHGPPGDRRARPQPAVRGALRRA